MAFLACGAPLQTVVCGRCDVGLIRPRASPPFFCAHDDSAGNNGAKTEWQMPQSCYTDFYHRVWFVWTERRRYKITYGLTLVRESPLETPFRTRVKRFLAPLPFSRGDTEFSPPTSLTSPDRNAGSGESTPEMGVAKFGPTVGTEVKSNLSRTGFDLDNTEVRGEMTIDHCYIRLEMGPLHLPPCFSPSREQLLLLSSHLFAHSPG